MNFIPCRLERGVLAASGLQVRPPDAALQSLMSFEGCELELGIRPEDILPAGDATDGVVETTIEVVEPMGSENYVFLRLAENTLISRMPPSVQVTYGQPLKVRFRNEKMHVFNKKDGKTIF
jgi:multiple sugar transport system ATP-binding protein